MGKITLQSGITDEGHGLVLIIMEEPTNDGPVVHVADMNSEEALKLALDLMGQAVKADYSATLAKRLRAGGMKDQEVKSLLEGIGDSK